MEHLQCQNSTHHYIDGLVGAVSLSCESLLKFQMYGRGILTEDIKESEGSGDYLLQKPAKSLSICPKKKKETVIK